LGRPKPAAPQAREEARAIGNQNAFRSSGALISDRSRLFQPGFARLPVSSLTEPIVRASVSPFL